MPSEGTKCLKYGHEEKVRQMELITAYNVHADLRAQLHDLSRKLEELEARVWKLKDEFYHHMDEADEDIKDAMKAVAERANR